MKKVFLFSIALATLFVSCKKHEDDDNKSSIYKGPIVQIYKGKAYTWVQLNKNDEPQKVAVVLNDDALNSLPTSGGGHMDNVWVLNFHPKFNTAIFNHVGLGWNPMGHEPAVIYGLPHFDFHFFMITPEEVAAIPAFATAVVKFNNWPAAAYFPTNYINRGGGVPMMGAHWIDVTSSEFNGQKFTQTFIFGSYDGMVNFYEPMITLDFLRTHGNFERSIPQPSKFQRTGWYPTKLTVSKHEDLTEIILGEFIYKTKS